MSGFEEYLISQGYVLHDSMKQPIEKHLGFSTMGNLHYVYIKEGKPKIEYGLSLAGFPPTLIGPYLKYITTKGELQEIILNHDEWFTKMNMQFLEKYTYGQILYAIENNTPLYA